MLLADFDTLLAEAAPQRAASRRDDERPDGEPGARRTRERPRALQGTAAPIVGLAERRRGTAAARALERVFLVELDGPRVREVRSRLR